ncbi:MAG: hypothetical protein DRQ39_07195 [Gammaproteobacteria bacterium]|nr:MAG: hypothetical protein DRQ39_07195 [Gammaproteobacteria bacterium]
MDELLLHGDDCDCVYCETEYVKNSGVLNELDDTEFDTHLNLESRISEVEEDVLEVLSHLKDIKTELSTSNPTDATIAELVKRTERLWFLLWDTMDTPSFSKEESDILRSWFFSDGTARLP